MENKLILTEDQDKFLAELNNATGHNNNLPMLPLLKFDAEKGYWKESTDEKDADKRTIYKEIGESIDLHIITTRKMVQSKFGKGNLYSREFQESYLILYDENKTEVFKGFYGNLKETDLYKDLNYVQVLYAYYKEKLYRVKLSGSKLSGLFEYMKSFNNSNPALFFTTALKGEKTENGGVKYYELNFKRGETAPQKEIVERVNYVNTYLSIYQQIMNVKKEDKAEELPTIQVDDIHSNEPMPEPIDQIPDEIKIEDIPF